MTKNIITWVDKHTFNVRVTYLIAKSTNTTELSFKDNLILVNKLSQK